LLVKIIYCSFTKWQRKYDGILMAIIWGNYVGTETAGFTFPKAVPE
jgi:hypothetical protein